MLAKTWKTELVLTLVTVFMGSLEKDRNWRRYQSACLHWLAYQDNPLAVGYTKSKRDIADSLGQCTISKASLKLETKEKPVFPPKCPILQSPKDDVRKDDVSVGSEVFLQTCIWNTTLPQEGKGWTPLQLADFRSNWWISGLQFCSLLGSFQIHFDSPFGNKEIEVIL